MILEDRVLILYRGFTIRVFGDDGNASCETQFANGAKPLYSMVSLAGRHESVTQEC